MARIYDNLKTRFTEGLQGIITNVMRSSCRSMVASHTSMAACSTSTTSRRYSRTSTSRTRHSSISSISSTSGAGISTLASPPLARTSTPMCWAISLSNTSTTVHRWEPITPRRTSQNILARIVSCHAAGNHLGSNLRQQSFPLCSDEHPRTPLRGMHLSYGRVPSAEQG